MPRKSSRATNQPISAFHMTARRRASHSVTPVANAVALDHSSATDEPSCDFGQVETSDWSNPLGSQRISKKRKASQLESEEGNAQTTSATTRESTAVALSSTDPTSVSTSEEDKADSDNFNPQHNHDQWKNKRYWPRYSDKRRVIYEADANTRYKPGSQKPSQGNSPATGSPRRPTRGGRGGRGRGAHTNGNGRGRGRGRTRGGRDREESPDPPHHRELDEDQKETVKRLKARQLELKRVFSIIGAQQVDILDTMATRDINKLVRKPKAHKSVPEHEDVIADLEDTRDEIQDMIRARCEYMIQQENDRFRQEEELLEMQCKQRCNQVQEEHLKGLNGDITLLKKAHAHDEDEDRTESGSERDFLPFHHEFPESNTRARGYTSVAVQDEKSFREYIESSDDHVRQEVMQDEIRPLLEFIAKTKKKRQEEFDREKTQNFPALVEEANHRLNMDYIGGYLIPRPLAGHENQAYGLSALADVADYVAQQHPRQNYVFMPLSPGHHFPRNALNFDPLPGQRPLAPAKTAVAQTPPPPRAVSPSPPAQASFYVQQQQQRPPPHARTPSKELQPSFQTTRQPQYLPEVRQFHTQQEVRPVAPLHFDVARPAPAYPFQSQMQPQQYSGPPPRPALNLQTNTNAFQAPSHSRQSSLSTPVTSHMVSTGPGQPIAPAPPKPVPMSSVPPPPFRRPSDPPPYRQPPYTPVRPAPPPAATQPLGPPPPSPRSLLPPPSPFPQPPPHPIPQQNFIFQPPQQPPQHHAAPPPASLGAAWVPRYSVPASPNGNNPNISSISTHGLGEGTRAKSR